MISAMLFAAGLGTRLYPLTANKPKALVEYQGKPLLEHAVTKLLETGIEHIVVNVHHFGEQIIDFFNQHHLTPELIFLMKEKSCWILPEGLNSLNRFSKHPTRFSCIMWM